jgi:hypothetical protein
VDECANVPCRRNVTRTHRPPGWLALLVAAAGIGLAACSSGSSTPHVASLGKTSGSDSGNSPSTQPKGSPAQLLNEWTACMRSSGDPNQAEPTVDAGNGIHVTVPLGYFGTIYGSTANSATGAGVTCQAYLTAASVALNGGQSVPQPSLTTVDKWAECMRANGVPEYPEPNGGGEPQNPDSPAVQSAFKLCRQKLGFFMPMAGGATIPGEIEVTNPNVPNAHNITVFMGPPDG